MNEAQSAWRAGMADTARPDSLSTKFRQKRDVRLRELISDLAKDRTGLRILDLGGSVEYWRRLGFEFLHSLGVRVVVLNVVETELKLQGEVPDLFSAVVGDACNLAEIKDGEFDLVHSNSVIEHVGNWSRMKQFGAEVRRTGRSYYVQTPYFWCPVEPHFYRAPMIHWLPRPLQARVLASFSVTQTGRARSLDAAFDILDGTQLLDRRQMQMAFPDAQITSERIFGMTKSMIAIRRA